jgi:hypothetical protein
MGEEVHQKTLSPERVDSKQNRVSIFFPPPALPGSGSAGRGLDGPPLSPAAPGSPLLIVIIPAGYGEVNPILCENVEKAIYGAYLYEKQAVLPPYIGSVFCFSTRSKNPS